MSEVLVFKTELRPNNVQRSQFASHFGASRFAYNCLLNWTIEEYDKHKADPTYPRPNLSQPNLQKIWVHELRDQFAPWYAQNSRDPYRHAAASLATAYKGFFSGQKAGSLSGHPTWKKRGSIGSYAVGNTATLVDSGRAVRVPRIGIVRLHEHMKAADWLQRMGATLQDAIFSSDATGRIYVSIRYRVPDKVALAFLRSKLQRKSSGFVGVDLGLKEYATVSDGQVVNNPRYYRNLEAKLARAQRALSIKKVAKRKANSQRKDDNHDWGNQSKNHDRAKAKVARLHRTVRNKRLEFLNQTARHLITHNITVVIEDLAVEAMKQKFGKSVSDASPAEFRRILTYMSARYGTTVIVADRWFPSSKTCSSCGTVKAKLSLSERQYRCSCCGLSMDRDLNAALNLKAWGEVYLAQQAAARYAEALNGRGPENLIVSDQSRRKPAGALRLQSGNASHGRKSKNSIVTSNLALTSAK